MSTFYGNLRGARGEATRCGTKSSGIRAAVRSWNGSVVTSLWEASDGKLMVNVATSDYSDGTGQTKFAGTFDEFKEVLKLKRKIDSGEASVVMHRKKKSL